MSVTFGKSTCERAQLCIQVCRRVMDLYLFLSDYWYRKFGWMSKNTHLWCDFCLSKCVALSAGMNSSMLNGPQLLLSVINIPAVEILACIGKHDKTATHLLPCSQHRLAFDLRGTGSTKDIKNNLIISDRSCIFLSACLPVTHTVILMCCCFFLWGALLHPSSYR